MLIRCEAFVVGSVGDEAGGDAADCGVEAALELIAASFDVDGVGDDGDDDMDGAVFSRRGARSAAVSPAMVFLHLIRGSCPYRIPRISVEV
jgi:hypothetical protein